MALLMEQPRLLLKVGLMQAFTTLICMGWFGQVYYGSQSWLSSASEIYEAAPSIVVGLPGLLLEWPSFVFQMSWLSINWPSKWVLAVSLGVLSVEYLQEPY